MTIKPVVAPSQKRNVSAADAEGKKESHNVAAVEQNQSHSQQSGRSAATHSRNVNVVIDGGHGQSPQRRGEIYDELARHRRSPHKNTRAKRRDHHDHHHNINSNKRERAEREKHASAVPPNSGAASKCSSPHIHNVAAPGGVVVNNGGNNSPAGVGGVGVGGESPERLNGIPGVLGCQSPKSQTTQVTANLLKAVEETYSGYNSGDEHLQPKEGATTVDEWQRRDEQFSKSIADRGFILKPVEEDGACLFRAISLQIYGDEEMHDVIRQHTMDYIFKNREYFSHFVTEDINSYIKRKRRKDSHGNHIEIQAMSEIYSRPVEVYCYKPNPINIFNSEQLNNGHAPLRLSYQRGSHYNAIIDPYNATVGVGLGLAGYKPELQTKEAARLSEQLEIEQTMFEDKLKTTDWEATNEAIEEQIARESYLQWCRENIQKTRASTTTTASTSATVTSAEAASDAEASPSKYSMQQYNNNNNSSVFGVSGNSSSNSSSSSSCNTSGNINSSSGSTTVPTSTATTIGNVTAVAANLCIPPTCSSSSVEHNFAASPKSLSALAHNLKKDTASTCDLGFDSDDTDMSSTSSMGAGGGNASPSARRAKKTKKLNVAVRSSSNKKRRRDIATLAISDAAREVGDVAARKSPKRDTALMAAATAAAAAVAAAGTVTSSCSQTPEAEQQPCTSKQSNTPEKRNFNESSNAATTSSSAINKKSSSSFYQELLEASIATGGYGQLTESQMLQRAIQMSTQDYIEDQKRKYFYGP